MPEKLLNDDAELGIPCRGCGRETRKTIGWMRANEDFACPACGYPIHVQSKKLVAAIDRARETVIRILRAKD